MATQYSKAASAKVKKVMEERKAGTLKSGGSGKKGDQSQAGDRDRLVGGATGRKEGAEEEGGEEGCQAKKEMTDEAGDVDREWKLKLRYGKLETPFKHFTIIAEGIVGTLSDGFTCRPGNAFFGMKVWAASTDEAGDMARKIGGHVGFNVTKKILVYNTEPEKPPKEGPYGYDLNFTPFD